MIHKMTIQTAKRDELVEITTSIAEMIRKEKFDNGMAVIYCPHTTAGSFSWAGGKAYISVSLTAPGSVRITYNT